MAPERLSRQRQADADSGADVVGMQLDIEYRGRLMRGEAEAKAMIVDLAMFNDVVEVQRFQLSNMASSSAIRFVRGSKKSPLGSLHLQLRVKPGASKNREGIAAITDDAIELCISAQAREGEANKAVVQVLSGILGVPKSSLQLTHGMKSRDKTVVVEGIKGDGEEYARTIREILDKALEE
ncbi:hypothetical protein F66182_5072 [Fusarium sp. NRRL 66182]|nr:hypothetical protein F66182_5072 [Fusarium sp. NRRL 66182]